MVVNPLPAPISAPSAMCKGSTYLLSSATPGGTWSAGDMAIAVVGSATGATFAANTGVTNVMYMLPSGCVATTVITVTDVPEPITGTASVCAGEMTTLSNVTPGGSWSVSSGFATVNTVGEVTGVAAGLSTVTYTGSNGCRRLRQVTVNALPALIAGPSSVCQGLTIIRSNASPGGTWSSSDEAIAAIGSSTGVVTAVAAGTASISYTLANGCSRNAVITVHPTVEPITGDANVCEGSTTTMSSASAGGIWTSSNTARLTADPLTGVVTGVGAGTAVVIYTLPTGCNTSYEVMVDPLPSPITGNAALCAGNTLTLASATTGAPGRGAIL